MTEVQDQSTSLRSALSELRAGNVESATDQLNEALVQDPGNLLALILAARLARQKGELEDAAIHLDLAARIDDEHPQLVAESGYLAMARDNAAAAVTHFEHLSVLVPDLAEARFNLGQAYQRCGRGDAALAALRKSLELGIDAPHEVHAQIGTVLSMCQRDGEAREQFERALTLHPGLPRALHGLGTVSAAFGDFDAAEDFFRRALAGDPDHAPSYQRLAEIKTFASPEDEDIEAMLALLAKPDNPAVLSESLHFALGKAFDDIGDFEQAFDHYTRANEMRASRVASYDPAAFARRVQETVDVFDGRWGTGVESVAADSRRPIFLFGMPRAGATLVEHILAAHPEVERGNEIPFFDDAARLRLAPYPLAVAEIDDETAAELAQDYLTCIDAVAPDVRVTNRHRCNFLYAGLMAALFPNASLIYCRRDPLDNCLSVYCQDLPAEYSFAGKLQDIAHHYQHHTRIMSHWQRRLDERLLVVDYELLVDDPTGQIERLLAHVGLDADDACLAAHEQEGVVSGPSRWQVRQPIYRTSTERWRHYAPFLEELADALGVSLDD